MTHMKDEQELLRRLSDLPREVKPGNDVWPGIATRISRLEQQEPGPRYARTWPVAIAASFILMIAAGLFLQTPEQAPAELPQLADSSSDISVVSVGYVPTGLSAITEPEYQAAFREFMVLNRTPGHRPHSEWVDKVWTGLWEIEVELLDALRIEPENDFLNTRMAALRAHQLDILKEIAEMDQVSRRNTI
jgi:hypothetical protein